MLILSVFILQTFFFFVISVVENKIRELEMLSKEKDNAIKHLEEQITINKTYTTEVSETLQRTEKQLVEMKQKFESYKKSSEKK